MDQVQTKAEIKTSTGDKDSIVENNNEASKSPPQIKSPKSPSQERVDLVAERAGLGYEEKKQLSHGDKFWGIDAARKKKQEKLFVPPEVKKQQDAEDKILTNKQLQQLTLWENEARELMLNAKREKERKEREAMEEYMRTFWSSSSSTEIINHHWKTRSVAKKSLTQPQITTKDHKIKKKSLTIEVNPIASTPKQVEEESDDFHTDSKSRFETYHKFDPITSTGKKHGFEVAALQEMYIKPDINDNSVQTQSSLMKSLKLLEEAYDSFPRLPLFGSNTPLSPLGSAFLAPNQEFSKDEDAFLEGLILSLSDKICVPISNLRELRFVTARGYIYKELKQNASNTKKQWTKVYCALWRTSVMYIFKSEQHCLSFFAGDGSISTNCLEIIDCEIIISVRESGRHDLMHRGIELIASRKLYTICIDSDAQFAPWMKSLSNAVTARNAVLYDTLIALNILSKGDMELLNTVEHTDVGSLNSYTLKYLSLIEASKIPEEYITLTNDDKEILENFRLKGVTVGSLNSNENFKGFNGNQLVIINRRNKI